MQADAVDGDAAVVRPFDDHAHVTEGLQGRQGVFALEEAFDFGHAFSQGAEHDGTVGNGLVARYADASGEFATRLRQVNQIIVVHGVHIGPAGQDFAEMLAGEAGAGEHAQQFMPVPCVDRAAQGVEVGAKCVQYAQHRLAVGEEDVVPHDRVATGDPREIAEATGGITEDFQILAALGQRVDQAERQQVRQMAGGGEHFVVVLDLHVFDVRTQGAPQPVDRLQGRLVGVLHRGEDDLVTAEQIGVGRLDAALLRAGDGMAGHETRRHAIEHPARGAHDIALGAADVSQHGVAQVKGGELGEEPFHRENGDGQLDHLGTAAGRSKVALATVDHTGFDGDAAGLVILVHAHHFGEQALLAQPLGEGAADQAEADHHQAPEHRGALVHGDDISHDRAPWPAPPGSGRSPPAGRWRHAGRSACRNRLPGAGSRLRRAWPG
ncbi:hypothetical protein D9M72_387880 [compost metagenome]